MKWINAEQQVTVTIYDEEHDEHFDKIMTVEEMLDTYTNEGCPTIYSNPEQKMWIPVSERLPEADGRYLCTYEDDIYENCVDFGSYENGEWYVDKVIAWMPLPKPYEPQESEDKE